MRRKNKTENHNINYDLVRKIQPLGGITFKDESTARTGDGYETCLHVTKFPKEVDDFWLANITNINGTVATIDISSVDVDVVKKNINRSMKELAQRYESATKYTEESDAVSEYAGMKSLMDEINGLDEVPKRIDARIFFGNRTFYGLEELVAKHKKKLDTDGYISYVNLNEVENDWNSMFQSYIKQQQNKYSIPGKILTSLSLAAGNPFNFSCLEDEWAPFYGTTPTNGNVFFNSFTKTLVRKSYSTAVIGVMSSGKSTLLKKEFETRAILGDFIRTFDIMGEFTLLTNTFGGRVLCADGSDGTALNPLEILQASENEGTDFARHINKLTTMYRFWKPDASNNEVNKYASCFQEFYNSIGFNPKDKSRKITGRKSTEYPIFSDFLDWMQKKLDTLSAQEYDEIKLKIAKENAMVLQNIIDQISYIINIYGDIFNRHTTINNIQDEQIVTFDISRLKDMDPQVFDAQIFNLISLCWDNAVINGKLMMQKLHDGIITLDEVIHFTIFADESHRWINANKLQALDLMITYVREMRKYFGAFWMASQSIRDYVPEGSDSIAINKLKTLFELMQYNFIFNQSVNALHVLKSIFADEFTESQYQRIPQLETGSCILSIAGYRSLEFAIFITDEEEYIFNGGV